MLKPLEPLVLREGEEVEIVIRYRVFEEKDYRELVDYLARLTKGKVELLDLARSCILRGSSLIPIYSSA